MKRAIITCVILFGFLCASIVSNITTRHQLDIEKRQVSVLSSSLQGQAAFYDNQRSLYELRIEQLEKEGDAYQEGLFYWKKAAAYNGTPDLREFASIEELGQWLADNPVCKHSYHIIFYNCRDFSIDLMLSALADGYWMGIGFETNHMFNCTIIGNEVYKVDGTTREITLWGRLIEAKS